MKDGSKPTRQAILMTEDPQPMFIDAGTVEDDVEMDGDDVADTTPAKTVSKDFDSRYGPGTGAKTQEPFTNRV